MKTTHQAVNRMGSLFALCVVVQMIVFVLPMLASDGMPTTSENVAVRIVRWISFGPALLYLASAIIAFPLPGDLSRNVEPARSSCVPTLRISRGTLLALGFVGTWSTLAQALFLASPDGPYQWTGATLYVMLAGLAIVILRVVLGPLNLLPRSWRVDAEETPPTGIELPDQRFAPREGKR